MMKKTDWLSLAMSLRNASKLIKKGNGLEHEGYHHRLKWRKAAYEMERLSRALTNLLYYEHPAASEEPGLYFGLEEFSQ